VGGDTAPWLRCKHVAAVTVPVDALKPIEFRYHRPTDLTQALSLLTDFGEDGKVIAGGQSLVPLMNMRLARPDHLVDLNRVDELSYHRLDQGCLAIGAMTRWSEIEASPLAASGWPVLVEAIENVGHFQIRNRGTLGGSAAHADPAAELPAVLMATHASLILRSARGIRTVAASDFFLGLFFTDLGPDELVVELRFPAPPRDGGYGFVEFSRRQGDFAVAGAVCVRDPSAETSRLVIFGGASRATELAIPSRLLDRPQEWVEEALRGLEIDGDIHGGAVWRRQVMGEMAARACQRAAS